MSPKLRLAVYLIVAAIALFAWWQSRDAGTSALVETPVELQQPQAGRPSLDEPRVETRTGVGFRTRQHLVDHYEKHGHEFGDITMADYLAIAQGLRDAPEGGDVLEIVRRDGVITRFDKGSGTFLAFNRNLIIRTCFRPRQGEAYFRRQARR